MSSTKPQLDTPNFVVIECEAHIFRSIAETWSLVGRFGDAGRFLDIQSALITEDIGIGSVRKIADAILEVLVGQTKYSYTYAQTVGPMALLAYHGCLSLAEGSGNSCNLTYSITYDQAPIGELKRQDQIDSLRSRFSGAVAVMKQTAESVNS